jgi:transcriptional regulator with GAF, ATPase, and Fis domain
VRKIRIDLSLTFLVPLILAGTSVLALIFADMAAPGPPAPELVWLCAVCAGAVYLAATAMLLLVLGPMRRFIARTGTSEVLARPVEAADKLATAGELAYFDSLFGQVADVLGKLDAKARFPEIIGESRPMRGVFSQILKVAPTEATVLVTGESGTGKELVAKSIHNHSLRSAGPFVVVNCAAIPEGLLESELFGHEKGAFTDAGSMKQGKFELAGGGTLFLDEIGDMPLTTQAKILRAIQNRECERVGGEKPVRFDIRLVAATNRNLSAMAAAGQFREDLFHRINVINIHLPPLRERRQDIPLLAWSFLEASGRDLTLSDGALQRLLAYSWPGNVRELQNAMERASVMAAGRFIEAALLPEPDAQAGQGAWTSAGIADVLDAQDGGAGLDERLAAMEKSLIVAALIRSGGVQARAAGLLGIKQRSLWHRIRKYGLDPAAIKQNVRSGEGG